MNSFEISDEEAEFYRSKFLKRKNIKKFHRALKPFIDAGVSKIVYYDDDFIIINNLNYFYVICDYICDPRKIFFGYVLEPNKIKKMLEQPLEYYKYSFAFIQTHEYMNFSLSTATLEEMVKRRDRFIDKPGSMIDLEFEEELRKRMEERGNTL